MQTTTNTELRALKRAGFQTIEGAEFQGTAYLLMERESDHECVVLSSNLRRTDWHELDRGPAKRINRKWLETIGDRSPIELAPSPSAEVTRA